MSRPASGKRVRPYSAGPKTNPGPRGGSDMVSYEDLLVAQYLEELRKAPNQSKPPVDEEDSPYMQKLAHTHIVPTPNMMENVENILMRMARPKSATVWRPKSGKANSEISEAGSQDYRARRQRPFSAPVYKRGKYRPLSAAYGGGRSRPTSAKSGISMTHVRSQYKRRSYTIVVTAFKNGTRETSARITAPTIKILLEICTDKLELPNAARQVFLDNGKEVFSPQEIPRDSEVYISMGEPFKDPYRGVKKESKQQKTSMWTMNGVVWTQEAKKRGTKTQMSKRFRKLCEPSRRRVMVFRNGKGTGGVDIVANPDRFEDFLMATTTKLDLESYARVLYDWDGKEVEDLNQAPVLDECLQTWSTPVIGPLWVSKSEGFSPKGVVDFLTGLIGYTKAKLKEAKHYQKQLQSSKNPDTRDNVEVVAILSMSEAELEETLGIVAKDIEDFSNALNRLKEQINKLDDKKSEEQVEGYQYTLKHIEPFDMKHRMIGTRGIPIKVYENGSYENEVNVYFNITNAARGVDNDMPKIMERLLDQCGSSHALSNPVKNPSIRPLARKLYNCYGQEIRSIYDMEKKFVDNGGEVQEVWLSFGEPWKNPFTFALMAQFDKIRAFDVEGDRKRAVREQLMTEDIPTNESYWQVTEGVPDDFECTAVSSKMDPMEKEQITGLLETAEIDINSHFLRFKEKPEVLLFPDVAMDTKKAKGNKDVWPAEAQSWVISKAGYIYNKAMPALVLGVSEYKVSANLRQPFIAKDDDVTQKEGSRVEGFGVVLQKKASGCASQKWRFTPEGYIYATSNPEIYLTYLGARYGDEESHVQNSAENIPSGMRFYIAVCEKIDGKDSKAQRWALKQERFDNLGQWKHTQAENPKWNKKALSWPVKEDGELNEAFDWPMEGYIIPYAPPIKTKAPTAAQAVPPLRLMVLKNGIRDMCKAVAIVRPGLTNMRKDVQKGKGKHRHGKKEQAESGEADTESIDVDEMLHCDEDLTVLKLELILFLERCTSLINLPFAARRLFDESGKEHFTMRSLQRDQLVYVSCGEAWTDPNLSKAEQQRRYLLANLASDVAQIRQFVALRNAEGLALEVEGALVVGANLVVNDCALVENEDADGRSESKKKKVPTATLR